ncbi:uncharacterized protein LOC110895325 isoform X1 [Helianthus annuus]|uniref:uncharacterized protein LOC110895325 isoform X1 n=1 Tax=Helianthus annuus TaxID=4232 RepID=UPI000B90986B|nr:uncharacterized protein LOC110895325 isoform X1 [Helianthus annuus]XP_035839737.1 uncharacterized protein LOC110895325 isoform X1 [Helianthus annuus]
MQDKTMMGSTRSFRIALTASFPVLDHSVCCTQDEVVKVSPHARAIRDVEDEELRSFFYGMSPWQFMLMVAASSVGEELFYRVAVQGAFSDVFLRSTELVKNARGMASLGIGVVS